MSSQPAPDHAHVPGRLPGSAPGAPAPRPLRFFGTTWLAHDRTYAIRRLAVALTALIAAGAGALVLVLACQGLATVEGSLVNVLLVAVTAVCTATAYRRTWTGFGTAQDAPDQGPPRGGSRQDGFRPGPGQGPQPGSGAGPGRGFMAIGFLGVLLAYAARCAVEAPGERLHRAEYERAREEHARRAARRAGNPAAREKRNAKSAKSTKNSKSSKNSGKSKDSKNSGNSQRNGELTEEKG